MAFAFQNLPTESCQFDADSNRPQEEVHHPDEGHRAVHTGGTGVCAQNFRLVVPCERGQSHGDDAAHQPDSLLLQVLTTEIFSRANQITGMVSFARLKQSLLCKGASKTYFEVWYIIAYFVKYVNV